MKGKFAWHSDDLMKNCVLDKYLKMFLPIPPDHEVIDHLAFLRVFQKVEYTVVESFRIRNCI